MLKKINKIGELLSQYKFNLSSEKRLQAEIEQVLTDNGIDYEREYHLGEYGFVDFFIEGIAVEIKTKGKVKAIYRQCRGYCEHEDVKSLILVTNTSMGLPDEINNKPCFVLNLGLSHL